MNVLNNILLALQFGTQILARIPATAIPATLALELEGIASAAIQALAASKGKTVEEVIAGLKIEAPV